MITKNIITDTVKKIQKNKCLRLSKVISIIEEVEEVVIVTGSGCN